MEEKILAKSKPLFTNKSITVLLIVGAFVLVFAFLAMCMPFFSLFTPIILVLSLVCVLVYFWLHSYELTVTNKRIYGKVVFGKRVDLPVDSISATASSQFLKSVTVSTPSGKISFLAIKNSDEIYSTINKLLIERQEQKNADTQPGTIVESKSDEADQIMKYKELLDKGIITEEEFDAKKKQILGL